MFAQLNLFPEQASAFAGEVDALFFFLLGLTAFFTLLIVGLIVTFGLRYRRRQPTEKPRFVYSPMWLEITWTVVPLLINLFIFFWATKLYFDWATPPDDALEVFVVGKQWMWKTQHLGGQREINELHVPVDRPVKVTMISQDVVHSFYVPAFRAHQDALPNRYTSTWFRATKTGRFHLFCSEYCGTAHSDMRGEVVVLEREAYQDWLEKRAEGSLAAEGRKLFRKLQCIGCHNAEAQQRGPLLENVYGKSVPLRDGRSVLADFDYLRESILNPDAKVVAGFQPIMPSFRGQVSEEELLQLLTFIRSLGTGQTPQRVEEAEPPLGRVP